MFILLHFRIANGKLNITIFLYSKLCQSAQTETPPSSVPSSPIKINIRCRVVWLGHITKYGTVLKIYICQGQENIERDNSESIHRILRVLLLILLLLLLILRHVFTSSHPHYLLVVGVRCSMYACMHVCMYACMHIKQI